jgi:small subunit ribosomal protein S2
MAVVTMRQLLESGVHFGHQTRRWNPKMKRFIMTERNGIYIIDLQQSLAYIDRSYAFIKETVAKGGTVMFVGTKKQAQEAIAEQATRVGMPYVNQRWLGGMLTNFQTVNQRINRLKELDEIDFEDVAGSSRTKKELLQMRRERDKLNKSLGGIREMSRTPAAVWIVDTNKEHLAVEEARKLHIPIIGILDSNCDPDLVDFPIPGNDDAIRAVGLLTRVVADAVAEGLIARSGAKAGTEGEAAVGAEEPLAEWERELLGGDADKAADKPAGQPAAHKSADQAAEKPADKPAEKPAEEKTVVETAVEATGGDTSATATPASEATGAASEAPEADAAAEAAVEAPATEAKADSPAATEGEFGPDSAAPIEDGSAPEGFEIKGNKTSKKFHAPSSPWYDRTNAEVWFRTPEAAEAAGFVNAESKSDASA